MSGLANNDVVHLERAGDVAIIRIDNPPINAGSTAVRQGLLAAVRAFDSAPELTGAILIGAGRMFMAGSDMREFHAPIVEPHLTEIIDMLQDSAKPVVAAIAGAALGGGYELSLGCDARIATPEAVVGLPECLLGMMPGAGGTQRMTRLVGMEKSVALICAGTRVKAAEAARIGMIDAVADGDLLQAALAYLREMGGRKRRAIDQPLPPVDEAALEKAKALALKRGHNRPNFRLAIESIENCRNLPAAEALAVERKVFLELRAGREAAALCHLFFAERDASKGRDLAGIVPAQVERLAVIGEGEFAAGIAALILGAGKSVILVGNDEQAARDTVHARLRHRGGIAEDALAQALMRLTTTTEMSQVELADAVVDATGEDIDAKRQIAAVVGRIAKPGTPFFTTTTSRSVTAIATASGRPQDVAGVHFVQRGENSRLIEIIRHPAVDLRVVATGAALAHAIGKLNVVCSDLIGERIYAAYYQQCEFMLEEGALPQQIDQALEDFGFALGPFATADLRGLDGKGEMNAGRGKPIARQTRIRDMLCKKGRLGRDAGAGYYRYGDDGSRKVDPQVTALLEQASREAWRSRKVFSHEQIVIRALAAMASEAALAISEKVVAAPSDIDLVLTTNYGFPRHEGGIVFWARNRTDAELKSALRLLAEPCDLGFLVEALRPRKDATPDAP